MGGPTNGGPEEFGRFTNWPPEGEPKGPGPLKGGPVELEGGGKPWGGLGPGPGVDEPEGAGEAVYWGVVDPAVGPEKLELPAGLLAPVGGPWNGEGPW